MEITLTKGDISVTVKGGGEYADEMERMLRRLFEDVDLGLPIDKEK